MSEQTKVFVGNCKVKTNNFNEKETNIGFTAENLETLKSHLNEKGWVNVTLKTSKEGKPYLQVDTWKPNYQASAAPVDASNAGSGEAQEELPF